MSTPFCDWLSVTVGSPSHVEVSEGVQALLDGVGVVSGRDKCRWAHPDGGSVSLLETARFSSWSFSGEVLALLRGTEVFSELLRTFSEVPHSITRLDAAYDLPVDGQAYLEGLYPQAFSGRMAFGQRRIPRKHVKVVLGPCVNGGETGTLYLGGRRHELSCRVYDKRQERIDRGCGDPGPLTRIEVTGKRRMGLSLRDAWDPSDFLFHVVAGPLGLAVPPSCLPWVSGGQPLHLPRSEPVLPYVKAKRLIESDHTLDRLRPLAAELGPDGEDILMRLIRRRLFPERPALPGQAEPAAGSASVH